MRKNVLGICLILFSIIAVIIMIKISTVTKSQEETESNNQGFDYSSDNYKDKEVSKINIDGQEYTLIKPIVNEEIKLPLHMQYLKDTVSESDLRLLMYLNNEILNMASEIDVSNFDLTEEKLAYIYNILAIHQLDISYTDSVSYSLNNGKIYKLFPAYRHAEADLGRYLYDVNDNINEITSQIDRETMSDYEIVKTIHDYIIQNSRYVDSITSDDLYNILLYKTAKCEGYSKLFTYICNKFDIETILVVGSTYETHMWNMVNLDGKWYHIDVTWDDLDSGVDEVAYDYFLKSDDLIFKTHKASEEFIYPKALEDYSD